MFFLFFFQVGITFINVSSATANHARCGVIAVNARQIDCDLYTKQIYLPSTNFVKITVLTHDIAQ